MDDIIAEHESEGKTSVHARAVYNISDSVGIDEDLSSLKLLFKWPNPRQLKEAPPMLSTFVELQVKVCFKDDRIACHKMYDEIELLKGFKSGLDNQGLKLRKRQEDDPELMDELRKLLVEVKHHGPRSMAQVGKEQSKKPFYGFAKRKKNPPNAIISFVAFKFRGLWQIINIFSNKRHI